jgi:hypothetical protein
MTIHHGNTEKTILEVDPFQYHASCWNKSEWWKAQWATYRRKWWQRLIDFLCASVTLW